MLTFSSSFHRTFFETFFYFFSKYITFVNIDGLERFRKYVRPLSNIQIGTFRILSIEKALKASSHKGFYNNRYTIV